MPPVAPARGRGTVAETAGFRPAEPCADRRHGRPAGRRRAAGRLLPGPA